MGTEKKKDTLAAAEQEANPPAKVTIDWHGTTYTLPPSLDDAPATVLLAMEQGKAITFVEEVLGIQQWRQFMSSGHSTGRDAADLMHKVLTEGYGLDLGKS